MCMHLLASNMYYESPVDISQKGTRTSQWTAE